LNNNISIRKNHFSKDNNWFFVRADEIVGKWEWIVSIKGEVDGWRIFIHQPKNET